MLRLSLSVRSRLFAGSAVMLGLVAVAAGAGILVANGASSTTRSMMDTQLAQLMAAKETEAETLSALHTEQQFLNRPSDELAAQTVAAMERGAKAMESVKAGSSNATLREQATTAQNLAARYTSLFNEVVSLTKRRGFTPEQGLQGELRAAVHSVEKAVGEQGLAELSVTMLMCRRHEKDYMLRGDEKYLADIDKRITEFKAQMEKLKLADEMQAKLDGLWKSYSTAMHNLAAVDKQAKKTTAEFGNVAAQLERVSGEVADAAKSNMTAAAASVGSELRESVVVLWVVLGVSSVVACVVAWLTARSICRPLAALNERVRDVAQGDGDLTKRVAITRRDEIGEVAGWVNVFIEAVERVVAEVKAGAAQIDAGGSQIASASQGIAQGASEQASGLQQISASLEQIADQAGHSTENVRQASSLAEENKRSADRGKNEMAQMSKAVNEIKQSSAEISKIIKVIDEIAFQTNLLALNAAVEAARAGEAGKGFAVVAEEVRNLAQRSAEAAKNTAQMIEASVKRSENGVQIAARVGSALEEINASTSRVNELLAEIASVSGQQSAGIGQINQGVSQLDQVTQQNAGNSEELASSAEELSSQVASLNELVARFKVGGVQSPNVNSRVAAPASKTKSAKAPGPSTSIKSAAPVAQEPALVDDEAVATF